MRRLRSSGKAPSKSHTDESKDEGIIPASTAAKGRRDVASASDAKDGYGKIPDGGHDLSSGATAYLGAVFIEGHITDIVEAVFNAPVVAAGSEQALGIGAFGVETGDPVDGFGAEFVADQVRRFATNREDLIGVGKIQISVQFVADPDRADLQAAMSFIDCGVRRGEKTPFSGRRYLDVAWADYL